MGPKVLWTSRVKQSADEQQTLQSQRRVCVLKARLKVQVCKTGKQAKKTASEVPTAAAGRRVSKKADILTPMTRASWRSIVQIAILVLLSLEPSCLREAATTSAAKACEWGKYVRGKGQRQQMERLIAQGSCHKNKSSFREGGDPQRNDVHGVPEVSPPACRSRSADG